MRIATLVLVFILSACTTAKKYEDIILESLEDYRTDSVTYYVYSWIPFDSSKAAELSKEDKLQSDNDRDLCIDEYRGQYFSSEGDAVLFFMQCMNKKGWRLDAERVLIVTH